MTIEDFACDHCDKTYKNVLQLQNHRVHYHTVSLQIKYKTDQDNAVVCNLQRNDTTGNFSCPVCEREFVTSSAVRSHFLRNRGNCLDNDNLVGYLSSDEDVIIEDAAVALVTSTPPTVKILEAEDGHTVRRSYDEGLLGAYQQMGAPDDEKKKTLWIMDTMKLRPISLINNSGIEQTMLAHENSLNSITNSAAGKEYTLEYVAVGQKRPWDDSPSPSAATNKDQMEAALQSLLHYSPRALQAAIFAVGRHRMLSSKHVMGTITAAAACLRTAIGRAIIMNEKREAVMINCVEIYSRSRMLDADRENFGNIEGTSAQTSLPLVTTKYPNTHALVLNSAEGKKLTIGTKTLHALVTSSQRIDSDRHNPSVRVVTTDFNLGNNAAMTTCIFLDSKSIEMANLLALDPLTNKIDNIALTHQIRQLGVVVVQVSTESKF